MAHRVINCQSQVEYLRLDFQTYQPPSFNDIKPIIENCDITKLTIVCWDDWQESKMEHEKVAQLAKEHFIETEFVNCSGKFSIALFYKGRQKYEAFQQCCHLLFFNEGLI